MTIKTTKKNVSPQKKEKPLEFGFSPSEIRCISHIISVINVREHSKALEISPATMSFCLKNIEQKMSLFSQVVHSRT